MTTPDGPRFRRSEWILILVASATKLWLTAARTLEAIGWARHDDGWFLEKASSILAGQWLGDYGEMTLIKGSGYPLWVALVSSERIPLLFAQQLLYALCCLAVCRALAPSLQSMWARSTLFLVLLFNPMSFADEIATRVSREAFYPSLALVVFAGVAGVILRLDARRGEMLRWSVLSGFAIAYFWHTREEGAWILPLLACAGIALLQWVATDVKARWRRAVLVVAVPGLIFVAAYGAIVASNGLRYGVFTAVEFKEKSFVRAFSSLTHVRQHPSRPRVPVPKEVRERVYAVSPAFAELRPFLEGELGAGWANLVLPEGHGDISGATFMWAFRDAVARAGYYERGAPAVREYYDRLSREIAAARLAGRLDARAARASLLPPMLHGQRREVLSTWLEGLVRVVELIDFEVRPRYSDGTESELREVAEATRTRLAPRREVVTNIHLVGWVIHVDGALDLTIEHFDGKPVPSAKVIRLPSLDLYEHLRASWKDFPPARHARFDITVPAESAYLVLSLRGRTIERIPLGATSPTNRTPDIRMSVDKYETKTIPPPLSRYDAFRLRILERIGRAYQLVFPTFFVLTTLLYLFNARWLIRSQRDSRVAILIAGLLSAIGARVMILSMIQVTSFSTFTAPYEAPCHGLLLVACVLMACEATVAVRSRHSSSSSLMSVSESSSRSTVSSE